MNREPFFTIEVLILHSKNISPSMSSFGKIAGIDEILVQTRPVASQEASFTAQVVQGSTAVHLVRLLVYAATVLVSIIISILLLCGIGSIFGFVNGMRRKSKILQTPTIHQLRRTDVREFLISHYKSHGLVGLEKLQSLAKEGNKLRRLALHDRWTIGSRGQLDESTTPLSHVEIELMLLEYSKHLENLTRIGIIKTDDDNRAVFDSTFLEAVDNLVEELEN